MTAFLLCQDVSHLSGFLLISVNYLIRPSYRSGFFLILVLFDVVLVISFMIHTYFELVKLGAV